MITYYYLSRPFVVQPPPFLIRLTFLPLFLRLSFNTGRRIRLELLISLLIKNIKQVNWDSLTFELMNYLT